VEIEYIPIELILYILHILIKREVVVNMYTQNNTTKVFVKYSNTYNVFVKIYSYKSQNNEWRNAEINEKASEAYRKGKTIYTFKYPSNLLQEVKLYNGIVHCFAIINNSSYRVLYNYLPISELGVNDETELINILASKNVNFIARLGSIDNKAIVGHVSVISSGEKIKCKVINTYDSFLDYTNKKSLPTISSSNDPFLKDFVETNSNKVRLKLLPKSNYGIQTYNSNVSNTFTSIRMENIIIITSYKDNSLIAKLL